MSTELISGVGANGVQAFDVVCLHDSWGDQFGTVVRDWVQLHDQLVTGSNILRVGTSGDKLADVTAELATGTPAALRSSATVLICMLGLNDVEESATLTQLEADLQALITEAESQFSGLTRLIFATIPPPFLDSSQDEMVRQEFNYKLLTGGYDSYSSNSVEAVNVEPIFINASDNYAWVSALEDAPSGVPNNHPNELACSKIYDLMHSVLVNGYQRDTGIGVIGSFDYSGINNQGLFNTAAYTASRETSKLLNTGNGNTQIHLLGVNARSDSADENINLSLFEIDPSTKVVGAQFGDVVSLPSLSLNTYRPNLRGGLDVKPVNGTSYTVAFEHNGTNPRVLSLTGPLTGTDKPSVDSGGIDAGQAYNETSTYVDEDLSVFAMYRTLIETPFLSTAIPKQAYSKDSAISPLNLTGYIDGGVSFAAANLPTGLAIDEGVIYGTPTADEINTVTITATSATGTTADFDFVIQTGTETATTSNIPLTIQAGYTLVDLVSPDTTNASLLFGADRDAPVTGDHLEYTVTSTLDSGVTLSVAASGVWTVTEATEGDWVTDITVSRRVVQVDGSIGTEAVVTLNAATGLTTITSLVNPLVSNMTSSLVN